MSVVYKCKMCGGSLAVEDNQTVGVCEYCGTKQTLPRLDDEGRANLYDRASHFRRNNEYDKAISIYERILNEDTTDAEAYWSLVLCRYGIEYVEDPATHRRVPTVNRAQYTSIFDDEDYKSALRYADASQRPVYEAEAAEINEIQKGILAISQREEPFDVFICYKEEDDKSGGRTRDSVLANDLYHQLKQEGFRVFFSRITLEDKLGIAYEPYIFAALNSAKVMLVLGTKPEYFNAPWVKNEWSRYLKLIKNGERKTLIPAYRDMDPYDLPEEFSHLQAQDMSRLGFMQDLIRGVKKILHAQDERPVGYGQAGGVGQAGAGPSVKSLLLRTKIFIEDGDLEQAQEYCEKALDFSPECADAYFYKLLAAFLTHDGKKEEADKIRQLAHRLKTCSKEMTAAEQEYLTSETVKTCLALYLYTGLTARVKYLLSRHPDAANAQLSIGAWPDISPLNYAVCESGKAEIVELLLEHGANPNTAYRLCTDEKGQKTKYSPLADAILNAKSPEMVKALLERGADPKDIEARYKKALEQMNTADSEAECLAAAKIFGTISIYRDAAARRAQCLKKIQEIHIGQLTESKNEAKRNFKKYRKLSRIFGLVLLLTPVVVPLVVRVGSYFLDALGMVEASIAVPMVALCVGYVVLLVSFIFFKRNRERRKLWESEIQKRVAKEFEAKKQLTKQ